MESLVSILIPAYNAERWISEAANSALSQTWPNTEIIIVDDGSTDQTLAIARQYASSNVKVVSQPHQGAAVARNHAFSLSQGDYIQWLDADDALDRDKIGLQMQALNDAGPERVVLSSAWGRFFSRINKAQFTPTCLWADLTPIEWIVRKWEHNAHMQTATWLVGRHLAEIAGPWDTRLLSDDDGEYFFRILMCSEKVMFVPQAKVYYRFVGRRRLSRIGDDDRKRSALFLSMKLQIAGLRARDDSPRVRQACLTLLQTWLINFYPERMDIVDEAKRLAADLGGTLHIPPRLRRKYSWMVPLIGYRLAKRSQLLLRELRASMNVTWDKALACLERPEHG